MLDEERQPHTTADGFGMDCLRKLIIVADDFGIGPETDRAILELGALGFVKNTVLIVNSPHAERAVTAWNRAGRPIELGWHPALTIDRPVLAPEHVPSLVDATGRFWPLGQFLRRSLLGRLNADEVAAELAAQYARFLDLVGGPPLLVNSHQHVALFRPVSAALHTLLTTQRGRPYVRRVREPHGVMLRVPGARVKRTVLDYFGRRQARVLDRDGFPGCDWLAGITDPALSADPQFHVRWLAQIPGRTVELMVHPGHHDEALIGRDCDAGDPWLTRRVGEVEMLRTPEFAAAVRAAGFESVAASRLGCGPLTQAA